MSRRSSRSVSWSTVTWLRSMRAAHRLLHGCKYYTSGWPIALSGLFCVSFQVVLDVGSDPFFGLIYPEVTFAKNIRLKSQKPLHRRAPGSQIRAKIPMEGTVYVLAEEAPAACAIEVQRDRARRMTRRVETDYGICSEGKGLLGT